LRDVLEDDLSVIFEQQLDPEAWRMAAFGGTTEPIDRAAFDAKWRGILANPEITKKAIVLDGDVVGNISAFPHEGQLEIGYWIAREHWGKGIASQALAQFLDVVTTRPLHAAAAKDNVASLRVLEKCGFKIVGEGKGFSNARGEEVEEFLLELTDGSRPSARSTSAASTS
jgi:RimJ/RimL family protein N-acetyltransferase